MFSFNSKDSKKESKYEKTAVYEFFNRIRWPIDGHKIFESSAASIKSDGWIVGHKTMEGYSSKKTTHREKYTSLYTQKIPNRFCGKT